MHFTEAEKKFGKRLTMAVSLLALLGALLGLASADGAQRQKTIDLERRTTNIEARVDGIPADTAAIKATLISMDQRLGRIEQWQDQHK